MLQVKRHSLCELDEEDDEANHQSMFTGVKRT